MRIDTTGHVDTVHFRAILRIGKDAGGHNTCLDDLLLVINIIQEHVQRLDPLYGTAGEHLPLSRTK